MLSLYHYEFWRGAGVTPPPPAPTQGGGGRRPAKRRFILDRPPLLAIEAQNDPNAPPVILTIPALAELVFVARGPRDPDLAPIAIEALPASAVLRLINPARGAPERALAERIAALRARYANEIIRAEAIATELPTRAEFAELEEIAAIDLDEMEELVAVLVASGEL